MKTWDEMEPRERDAWVAEHIMGWRWVDGGFGFRIHPPEVINRMLPEHVFAFSQVSGKSWHTPAGLPSYTTDASADYEVLKRVRETWEPNPFVEFSVRLQNMLTLRLSSESPLCGAMMFYKPGDYSHAAYLAMNGGE